MPPAEMLSAQEQHKHLLLRWFEEVWNQSCRETIFELCAPDCVLYDGSRTMRGREEFLRFHDNLRAEFADFRVTPVVALAEGDLAALRWSVECRHIASGKPTQLTGISIVRFRNGQVIEGWQNYDEAAIAAQLAG